jgi:hypothetical protein
MRKILFILIVLSCLAQDTMAQPATVSVPVSIGRNNCNGSGGQDSVYFFNYVSPNLTNNNTFAGCKPVLRNNFPPLSGYSTANKPFTIFNASVAFNPADQMLYYVWTDYNVASPYKSYIWRWSPTACPTTTLDTLRTFNTDIGGITFDPNGVGYQLEFQGPAPFKAFIRTVNFTTGVIGTRDTLDLTGGKSLWNVGSGDITLTPSGQMYFVFDNKLFTPEYTSYGGATHHIKCTYIDTVRRPAGATALPGLAFGNGDLIASYNSGCTYRRIDPVTGDTAAINYTYAANKGVYSTDMTQINSGIGAAKKLVSVVATGSPNQYDVTYEVYVRNYGNVPLTSVQVTDNLAAINGILNVSNVSATMLSNPAGVSINPAFNGTTNTNLLLSSPAQSLPCYPVANNNFTIQIKCTISGVLQGVVYNNSAIATANGWRNAAVRDSSMNGNVPDLNQNDKPDDVGEGQPTPFIIILTPTTPPCATLAQTLYTQNFGTVSGSTLATTFPASPSASTTYTGTGTAPLAINRFARVNSPSVADPTNWISLAGHTGVANDAMMVVNADVAARVIYQDTMPVACPGQQYSVSFWAAFIGNATYQTVCDGLGGFKYPVFLVRIRDLTTGLVITQYTTDTIKLTSWQQHGMKWVMPSGYSNVILEIMNAGAGGCGNDFALDDIVFGLCDPLPTVSVDNPSACLNGTVTFTANVTDPAVVPGTKQYQWQVATALAGPYTNIVGATGITYTINPVAVADTGKFYRVIVAGTGNILLAGCQYISPGVKLLGLKPSVAPTSISSPSTTLCSPGSVTLTAVGATLGTGANYQWGTGAVVGTNPIAGATSSTYNVTGLTSTTTYWVRVENTTSPCLTTTGGVTTTITINQPSVAPTSITGPDICNPGSTTLSAIGGTLGTGANYQWGTGASVGVNPIAGATNPTYTVSPAVTTTYWVRIQNTTAPCTATTGGVTKIVNVRQPSVAPTAINAAATTFCNTATITLTAAGGTLGTGANYQWGTGAVVGANPIAGATGASYNVIGLTTTTSYWVRIENTTSPCTDITGGAVTTITVNQSSVAPTSITGGSICNPGSTLLTATGGTLGTGANYQWGTGSTVGVNPIAGATGPTYLASPSVTTTYWVRIENTLAPCSANTGGVTRVVTVTQPSVAPASISAPSTTFCNTGTVTLTAVGGTLGTSANYQWGTGSTVGVNPIAGATGATYNVSGLTSTTTYWVRIENTASPCTAATGGTTTTITINQSSVAPTSITGTGYCNPGSTTLIANGGTLGSNANYQWGTGSVVGTNPIAGATSPTYLASPSVTTTYWVRIENTSAPCTANTGGVVTTITVNQPSVAATSATRSKNNICPGISVNLGITGGTLGTGASWRWYTGSCSGTLVGTGASISVTPAVTTTYYVRAEGTCNTTACQQVTVNISCDIDKDKDGIADFVESAMSAAFADANGNSVINAYDPTYAGFVDYNNDYINDNFQADGDSDNDGIPNYLDPTFPGRIDTNGDGVDDRFDADKDGIINMLDLDSDNDGIPDTVEAYGVDTNGDGKIDSFTDTDGDGLSQNVDINNTGAYNTGLGLGNIDLDGDGIPNFIDLDSDNDGIPDFVESGGTDSNNDGKPDGAFVDANGDGIHDSYVGAGALIITGTDGNNDGKADSWPNKNFDMDLRPNAYDIDADGDGIVDVIEAGLPDANLNGIVDGTIGTDGWSTTVSAMAALNIRYTADGDALPDYLDIDSDGDGIPDNIEGQPTATYKLPTLTDADGDGLALPYDNTPAAFGGSGIFVYDHDGDGLPDYRDLDTDGDGQLDIYEGNDFNLNHIADDLVTPTGLDTDGDGLDNRFDSLTSTTNKKGTSYMMGTNGSTSGDATPGTRAPVQKKTAGQLDRDWRYVGTVLPVQILSFTGVLQGTNVALKWSIIAAKEIDRYEIERSTDNSTYIKVGTVTDTPPLNVQKDYASGDYVGNLNSEIIYYRLKVIAKTGEIKYSNILVIRRTLTKSPVVLMPNPARDYVSVRFPADKDGEAMIRIVDNVGKTILTQRAAVGRGINTVQVNNLTRFSSGVYNLQIFIGNDVITEKLVITR